MSDAYNLRYQLATTIPQSVGQNYFKATTCYEPNDKVADTLEIGVAGPDRMQFRMNRCLPRRVRFFTFRSGSWVPGEWSAAENDPY